MRHSPGCQAPRRARAVRRTGGALCGPAAAAATAAALASVLGCGGGGGTAAPDGGAGRSGGGGGRTGGTGGIGGAGGAGAGPGRGVFVEGSRLKAIYEEVAGTPPRLIRWYDTKLGFECTFLGTTGDIRCLPSTVITADPHFLFADAACTRPVAQHQAGVEVFEVLPESQCSATRELFRAGPRLGAGQPVYINSTPGCTLFAPDGSMWQELGEAIPLDTLVSGTAQREAGGARIVPSGVVGSDGSRQTYTDVAWDTERQETVQPFPIRDVLRWSPTQVLEATHFADPACTVPVAQSPCSSSPPKEVKLQVAGAPASDSGYFEVGPPADPGSIYWRDSACRQVMPIATSFMFLVGAPIPTATFLERTETSLGSGQVKLTAYGTPGGAAPAIVGGFFDTLHGVSCQAAPAADGIVRCLPALQARSGVTFADPACTMPLAFTLLGFPKPPLAGRYANSPGLFDYYPVLDPTVPGDATYARAADGTCNPQTIDRAINVFYTVGPKIPLDEFVPVTAVRPPG